MSLTRKILLTGGGGMVGQNILEHPSVKGWDVVAPRSSELNLCDYQATLAYIQKVQPDFIIHSAGRVGGIQDNIAHPVDFLVTNVDVGRNIILAARSAGVKKFLNLASSCMYPRNADNPLDESLVLKGELEPTNEGYALAKIYATRLCQYIQRENAEFNYKTLIPCNLYGRHDKFSPKHSHLIPAIIHKLHQAKVHGHSSVDIWGDGTARREFMYAGDVADAIVQATVNFQSMPELMNVGLGHDYSINEYYAVTAEVIGWHGQFVHDLSKPVGMMQKLVCVKRQKEWGWSSTTSLAEGIGRAYQFYLKEFAE